MAEKPEVAQVRKILGENFVTVIKLFQQWCVASSLTDFDHLFCAQSFLSLPTPLQG